MALASGSRIGAYEVTAQLGVGGMGEVYRAHDSTLGRDVAIKVLPEAFAQDAERLARFEREARTLASLNHPNIAAIYGLENADGVKALVMELVEGPTLADRIAQGPMPVDEALPIAKQIAEGLEAAHEQGIIHRDLKPANVKIRPDGTVKWRGDGRELFYYAADGQLMAVPVASGAALEVGSAVPLFNAPMLNGPVPSVGFRAQYDVTPDGQRFLLNVPVEGAQRASITVVLNWAAGLGANR